MGVQTCALPDATTKKLEKYKAVSCKNTSTLTTLRAIFVFFIYKQRKSGCAQVCASLGHSLINSVTSFLK